VLDESGRIALTCGFHAVTIRWAEGDKGTEQASYLVDSPSCVDVEGPVNLWQNDEQLRAFVAIKDVGAVLFPRVILSPDTHPAI
jgi:hypothetical protein